MGVGSVIDAPTAALYLAAAGVGAVAGGGKGAGIGAAAGGAAGAGGILLTRGRAATPPTETRLSFRLQKAVTITERAR